ncbi:MAG: ANTAR domain-containing protein, partial [Actinobacteria bacterium]|nr:ANTAR domain-containing protein [Actinomycetota bacterium]
MVLADLLAADLPGTPPTPAAPPAREPRPDADGGPAGGRRSAGRRGAARDERAEEPDVRQLRETVAQLEHALTVRVRVEQAIGVLAERHRLRPRQAFELLRSAARSRGRRVLEVAGEVVESSTNP